MVFTYSVPARRFWAAAAIDDDGARYEADRSLADNVRVLARAEWGPVCATRAVDLVRHLVDAEPDAVRAPAARQWAAAVLYAAAAEQTPRTLALIETRTGASPHEILARYAQLAGLSPTGDAPACVA